MTRIEQHKMIQELRGHEARMNREDQTAFSMLLKRDKDDEDLDSFAVKKLEELYSRYARKKIKSDIEERWKKLTGGA